MTNFAPPHKIGPRPKGPKIALCCGAQPDPSKKRTTHKAHAQCRCAAGLAVNASRINRLIVKSGKSRAWRAFDYGARKLHPEVFS
jgi:hypothetical protein